MFLFHEDNLPTLEETRLTVRAVLAADREMERRSFVVTHPRRTQNHSKTSELEQLHARMKKYWAAPKVEFQKNQKLAMEWERYAKEWVTIAKTERQKKQRQTNLNKKLKQQLEQLAKEWETYGHTLKSEYKQWLDYAVALNQKNREQQSYIKDLEARLLTTQVQLRELLIETDCQRRRW